MILANYAEFRRFFAMPAAALVNDQLPRWPGPMLDDGSVDNTGFLATNKLRAGSFGNGPANTSTFELVTAGGTVFSGTLQGAVGPLIDMRSSLRATPSFHSR